MAEPIYQRVGRIISARLEDTVDRMEAASSGSILREAMREVDRALAQLQAEHDTTVARREQSKRQQEQLRQTAEELTGKASFALTKDRPDLAEAAIAQQIDLEAQADKLKQAEADLAMEEARLAAELTAVKARKDAKEQELEAYLANRLDTALSGHGSTRAQRDTAQQLRHAEEAFDRILAADKPKPAPTDHVAEIEAMRKADEVAARLAALKSD
ncbi:PspA/IM30 family protein [Novosphingobium rosa]|uniref:PspA/IM30 family protein n=1 Tax=Novosphingobium rosa TaxID=76978 RepID=UPI0008359BF7|nr:PspA/IM30 family protein [Novosphingobium rosa]